MWDSNLVILILLTALATLSCTILPGLMLQLYALWSRIRRRPIPIPPLLGPLFPFELTRLARSHTMSLLRVLYAGLLFVGLLVSFLRAFREHDPILLLMGDVEISIDRYSQLGETYFRTFLICQLLALTILTPVFAAGSITAERDRGMLDYLRTSLLSSRELVVSKLTAQLVFLLGIVATGIPILTLTMLFGGVSGPVLIAAFAVAISSTLSLAAFSIWQATRSDSLRQVLFYCYGFVFAQLLMNCCCCGVTSTVFSMSPFWVTVRLLAEGSNTQLVFVLTSVFVAIHGSIAAILTLLAMGNIRVTLPKQPRRDKGTPKLATALEPQKKPVRIESDEPRVRVRGRPRGFTVTRVPEDQPLLWKEQFFSARLPVAEEQAIKGLGWAMGGGFLILGGLGVFVAIVEKLSAGQSPASVVNPVLRLVAMIASFAFPFLCGLRATGAVCRERQKRTLDMLLCIPVERGEILKMKWLAAVIWSKWWLVLVGVIAVAALVSGSVHPLGLVLGMWLLAGFLIFAVSLAIWLSIRCGSVLRATTWYLLVILSLTIAPLLLGTLVGAIARQLISPEIGGTVEYLFETVSIPYAVWQACFRFDEYNQANYPASMIVLSSLASGLIYTFAAWLFWKFARKLFEAEGRD